MTTVHSLQLRSLTSLPTIRRGECCDLKIETPGGERWWLCRKPPGTTEHRIIVERYNPEYHVWVKTQAFTDEEEM